MFSLSSDDFPTQAFKQNEFDCLNLNITCPAALHRESTLPVMVWLHGLVFPPNFHSFACLQKFSGGDRGSGSNWVYDGGALVRKSLLLGKPIITVTLK